MSLTPNEAADALRDIEATGKRSGEAFGYRVSAPFFYIWGLVWIVGYGLTDVRPFWAGIIWPAVVIAGTVASLLLRRAIGRGPYTGSWRYGALVAILWLFLIATYVVIGPVSPRGQSAFVPLIFAALYSGAGLWLGSRYVVTGVAVAVLTLGGFFYIHEHFSLWMAAVGGGGLILAGVWLRTA